MNAISNDRSRPLPPPDSLLFASAKGQSVASSEPDLLDGSVGYEIKRAQVRCDEALVSALERKVSPAQFSALSTIGANPGISQAALGAKLNISGPSVVKVVDALEKLKLIKREPTDNDRRSYSLFLTEWGISELHRYKDVIATYEKKISANLSPTERKLLLKLLAKVAPGEL